jgi:hypothetical protein
MTQSIYLCREHVQVGEELIHMATTSVIEAQAWQNRNRERTKTVNFDFIEVNDGVERKFDD